MALLSVRLTVLLIFHETYALPLMSRPLFLTRACIMLPERNNHQIVIRRRSKSWALRATANICRWKAPSKLDIICLILEHNVFIMLELKNHLLGHCNYQTRKRTSLIIARHHFLSHLIKDAFSYWTLSSDALEIQRTESFIKDSKQARTNAFKWKKNS